MDKHQILLDDSDLEVEEVFEENTQITFLDSSDSDADIIRLLMENSNYSDLSTDLTSALDASAKPPPVTCPLRVL